MAAHRFLLKDVDTFAGFAHAMHTYLSGVALADRHARAAAPAARCAHGFEYAFEDLLAADPRGLVASLVAPRLSVAGNASLVDGRRSLLTTGRTADARKLPACSPRRQLASVVWVRKGRFAFADGCNCSMNPEVRYTVLWLRERFWRAVRRRHELAITPRLPPSPPSGRTAATPVIICAHVRRGDVTWLDLKGRPSGRWVDTTAVLEVLDGVRQVLGGSPEPPAVEVHLFSEQKGWGRNDTAALLALAPGARVHARGLRGGDPRGSRDDGQRRHPADGLIRLLDVGGALLVRRESRAAGPRQRPAAADAPRALFEHPDDARRALRRRRAAPLPPRVDPIRAMQGRRRLRANALCGAPPFGPALGAEPPRARGGCR